MIPSVLPHPDPPPNLNKYVVKYDVLVEMGGWHEVIEPALWYGSARSLRRAIKAFALERRDCEEEVTFPGGFRAAPTDLFVGRADYRKVEVEVLPLDKWFETAREWAEKNGGVE